MIPKHVSPGVRYAVYISGNRRDCVNCSDTVYSDEFAIDPIAHDVLGIRSIKQLENSSIFDHTKLIPGFTRRFEWYASANKGTVALELWHCVSPECTDISAITLIQWIPIVSKPFVERVADYVVPWTSPPSMGSCVTIVSHCHIQIHIFMFIPNSNLRPGKINASLVIKQLAIMLKFYCKYMLLVLVVL